MQLMPTSRSGSSKYNYIEAFDQAILETPKKYKNKAASSRTCLTYNINELEGLPASTFGRIGITLNPFTPPHPSLVEAVWEYTTTPSRINTRTMDAMAKLSTMQNRRGLSFCVGWTWRGFWEDAVTAGLLVAVEHLGACVPFVVKDHSLMCTDGLKVDLRLRDHAIKCLLRVIYICLLLVQVLWYVSLAGLLRFKRSRLLFRGL